MEQRLEILDLLPEEKRIHPNSIYIPSRYGDDLGEVVLSLLDWVNFLREEVCFLSEDIPDDIRAIYHAAGYHYNVYRDFHALYFHNLIRNDKFSETMRLTVMGLSALTIPDYRDNCLEALQLYEDRKDVWEGATFSGDSQLYKTAQSIMKSVDDRYVAIHRVHDLERLISERILTQPNVHFVSDTDYSAVREAALRSCPRRNLVVQEILEQRTQREIDEAKAEALRVQRTLDNELEFATELLGKMAGYASVILIQKGDSDEWDGVLIQMWRVVLRMKDGAEQINNLVKGHGTYALFDFQMEKARATISEREVKKRRAAMLRQADRASAPLSRFSPMNIFGRKK